MRRSAQVMAFLSLFAFLASFLQAGQHPFSDPNSSSFGGEFCLRCHEGFPKVPPQLPSEKFDVVIVGGGMAGLAALHYLKDVRAVLLETQTKVGGQMVFDTWKGMRFAGGAAYFVEPYGNLGEFYRTENIPLEKIPFPDNNAWIKGKYYADCWGAEGRGKMPWQGEDLKNWVKFLEELEQINNTNQSSQPFENFGETQQQLDLISAKDWMIQKGLNEEMIEHLDLYIPSCFGERSDKISASAFANYISGELGGAYTLPGGLGTVADILYKNHKDKIRLGSHVTLVEQDRDEARVTYLDSKGTPHTIRAKTVITAVPCNLLPSIIPDLPSEKCEVISKTRYAAYMVAAVLCNEVLWDDKGYDTWIEGKYFKDIIDADWISRKGIPHKNKKQPHVLSLYIPLGIEGTSQMPNLDPDEVRRKIAEDLEKVIPGCSSKIEEIRLYRFGHSMHVAAPGFMTNSVPILRKPYFRIFFAGAEVEGLPCNESAILSGYRAAVGVRAWLWPDLPSKSKSLLEGLRRKVSGQENYAPLQ